MLSGKGKDGSRGEGRGAETSGPRGTCPARSAHEPPSGLAAGRSNAQRSGEQARPTPGRIAFEKPPRSESVTSQLPRPQRSGGRKGRNAVCSALGEGLPVSQTKAPRLREGGQSQGASRGHARSLGLSMPLGHPRTRWDDSDSPHFTAGETEAHGTSPRSPWSPKKLVAGQRFDPGHLTPPPPGNSPEVIGHQPGHRAGSPDPDPPPSPGHSGDSRTWAPPSAPSEIPPRAKPARAPFWPLLSFRGRVWV